MYIFSPIFKITKIKFKPLFHLERTIRTEDDVLYDLFLFCDLAGLSKSEIPFAYTETIASMISLRLLGHTCFIGTIKCVTY